jgi:hypothetical protein
MPLYRSARLFTLGLALAGTCAAQNTQENKSTQRPSKQQRADKSLRKAQGAKPPKRMDKAPA